LAVEIESTFKSCGYTSNTSIVTANNPCTDIYSYIFTNVNFPLNGPYNSCYNNNFSLDFTNNLMIVNVSGSYDILLKFNGIIITQDTTTSSAVLISAQIKSDLQINGSITNNFSIIDPYIDSSTVPLAVISVPEQILILKNVSLSSGDTISLLTNMIIETNYTSATIPRYPPNLIINFSPISIKFTSN